MTGNSWALLVLERRKDMDVVEYVEKVMGLDLLDYQKQLLTKFASIPRDARVINTRLGFTLVIPVKEEKNEKNTNIIC